MEGPSFSSNGFTPKKLFQCNVDKVVLGAQVSPSQSCLPIMSKRIRCSRLPFVNPMFWRKRANCAGEGSDGSGVQGSGSTDFRLVPVSSDLYVQLFAGMACDHQKVCIGGVHSYVVPASELGVSARRFPMYLGGPIYDSIKSSLSSKQFQLQSFFGIACLSAFVDRTRRG